MVAFFFQAEDGIRDLTVTGVQTCALPIYHISIFDRDETFERRSDGEGLGLNLCKQIVLLHHGKIWVDSDVKIGRASCRKECRYRWSQHHLKKNGAVHRDDRAQTT